jgi:hypothetical protein
MRQHGLASAWQYVPLLLFRQDGAHVHMELMMLSLFVVYSQWHPL